MCNISLTYLTYRVREGMFNAVFWEGLIIPGGNGSEARF